MQRSEPIPERIGRYSVESEIGRGMMGAVYQAFDPALERRVALKVIDLAFPVSDSELESFETRFMAEGQIVARLSHPGIVTVHDVGRDEILEKSYLALEYLVGRTLEVILEEEDERLDWRTSLRIVAQVARALHYAHAQGVVHRDVKPANIMILEGGEPKIMDFGVAKLEAGFGLTSTGQFMGSPLYMSPEQTLAQPVDGRSDLFSLGSMAYAMLSGEHAFQADAVPLILNRVAYHDPPPPSQLVNGLPSSLDYVLARALAKPPDRRYPDGETMAEDIEDVLSARAPRHREGWQPPRQTGGGTVIADSSPAPANQGASPRPGQPEVSAARSTLPSAPPTSAQPEAARAPLAESELRPRPGRSPRRARPRRWPLLLAAAGGLAAILASSDFWQPRVQALLSSNQRAAEGERIIGLIEVAADEALSQAGRAAQALAEQDGARATTSAAPRRGSDAARAPDPRTPSSPSVRLPPSTPDATTLVSEVHVRWPDRLAGSPETAGRLSVSLESEIDAATLTIWVDGTPAFRASTGVPTPGKRTLIFRDEDGGYLGTLLVATGEHHVRVEVADTAGPHVKTIASAFGPERSRHLYVVAGIGEDPLSLAWRDVVPPPAADGPQR